MPIIIGNGSSIEGGSGAFRVRNSSGTNVFEQGIANYSGTPFGYYNSGNIPMFVAGRASDPSWVSVADGAWRKVNDYCTDVGINIGSCYNASTTRFTAPISGPYYLMFSAYTYAGGYYHPVIGVNGSPGARHGSETKYRIRGHGYVANYQTDSQIEEVIWLQAGDYCEVFWATSGTAYHYPLYDLFAGVYVG